MSARLVLVMVVLAAAPALAGPGTRVVLADSDPELRLAIESALAPWHAAIVVEPTGTNEASAPTRAEAQTARFVVWREGDQLVVFDRERANAERRTARAGALDPVAAAAAALTVKTLMRLPPPEVETRPAEVAVVAPAPVVATRGVATRPVATRPVAVERELRVQVGGTSRVAQGSETELGARGLATVMLRPWSARGFRFGLAGELGTAAEVSHVGFKGTWRDWSLIAEASWTRPIGAWELEPYVGVGFVRSTLSGIEMSLVRDETAMLAAVEAGVWWRRRLGAWSVAGGVRVQGLPSTPTYTRNKDAGDTGSSTTIYTVPMLTIGVGLVVAADLGL